MKGKLSSTVTFVERHGLHCSFPSSSLMLLFPQQPSSDGSSLFYTFLAGVDAASFQGHSVHSAASSAAKKLGVSSAEIMMVADWSRESSIVKFYHKPTKDTPFGKMVLSTA